MSKRKHISTKARLEFFRERRGMCALCGGRINGTREAWDIEHTIPLSLGGDDEPPNWTVVHRKCHAAKTRHDARNLAEARHREARHIGAKAPSRHPLPGGRNSRWQKKITGEVVPRRTHDGRVR